MDPRELLQEAVEAREDAFATGDTRAYSRALARERVLREQVGDDAAAVAAATPSNTDPDADGDDDYAMKVAQDAEGLPPTIWGYGAIRSTGHMLAKGEAQRTHSQLRQAGRRHRQALERVGREAQAASDQGAAA